MHHSADIAYIAGGALFVILTVYGVVAARRRKPPTRLPAPPQTPPAQPAAPPTAAPPAAGMPAPSAAPAPAVLPPAVPVAIPAPVPVPAPAPAAPIAVPAPAPAAAPPPTVEALRTGLARTRGGFIARMGRLFEGRKELDPALIEQLEEVLLTADIGVKTSQRLFVALKESLGRKEMQDPSAVWGFIRDESVRLLDLSAPPLDPARARPFVILTIGVNGVGKTTTIGKLAAKLSAQGKKVVLAAGDTFRAAAAEQLEIWAKRAGAELVRGKEGADPASVAFTAVQQARDAGADVVIVDTAGRLHTKTSLMEELAKVRRILGKAMEGAPHETLLVLDSTNGQNAIAQAKLFLETLPLTGIVLTKLDGTAKGGVILGICDELKVPVRYIGIGERVEDLREFQPAEFVEALYDRGGMEEPAA